MLPIKEEYHLQDSKHRKRVVQRFCYVCAAGNTFTFLPDIYYQSWITVSTGTILTCFFLFMSFVNKRYSTDIAVILLLGLGNIFSFFLANLLGKEVDIHYLMIMSVLFIPFIVNLHHKKTVFFLAALPFTLLLILEITNFSLLPRIVTFTADQIHTFAITNVLTMLVVVPFIVFSIINTHTNIYNLLLQSGEKMENQNATLAKTNAELDKFVYSVSHDLRSPIASTLGLINLSKQETNLETLREYELLKEKSLQKLEVFIRNILDYSRNTRTALNPQLIDWQHFTKQAIEQHQHNPEVQRLLMTSQVQQVGDFYTDHYRVGIIFNNLISNAIRYQDGYKEQPVFTIRIVADAEKATLFFEDNGIGIMPQYQDKVFNMFYRATENSKGSGLGLYIVAESIEKLQGNITLQSQAGQGTTFIVELPQLKPDK
jgi:signal transduction histidine kinase